MTSANVIEYRIFNKERETVGQHRQNIMCYERWDKLLTFIPLYDHTIQAYGYNEEDEYWENKPENLLTFLLKKSEFNTQLRMLVSNALIKATISDVSPNPSEDEIRAGNEEIAAFAGGHKVSYGEIKGNADVWEIPDRDGLEFALFYNNSMDWLIPVIDRIHNAGYPLQVTRVPSLDKSTPTGGLVLTNSVRFGQCPVYIHSDLTMAVWGACLSYIRFRSKQKTSTTKKSINAEQSS